MAIADIRFMGAEMGDLSEFSSTSGSIVANSATKRTGGYAFKTTASGGTGYGVIKALAADGSYTNIARTAETFYTLYLYLGSYPAAERTLFSVDATGPGATSVIYCNLKASGAVYIHNGTTSSSDIAAPGTGAWLRFDLRVTSNATCGLKIDGGTEVTVTGANATQNWLCVGSFNTHNDVWYDDIVVGTTSPGGPAKVVLALPDGDGTDASGFTSGPGSTYTQVDEVPHDSFTSYWYDDFGGTDARGVTLVSAATAGAVGTIFAATAVGILKDNSGTGGIRMRSGSSTADTTQALTGGAWVLRSKLSTTDPATGAAWTSGGIDTLQVAATSAGGFTATMLGAMVCCDGVAAAAKAPPPFRRVWRTWNQRRS